MKYGAQEKFHKCSSHQIFLPKSTFKAAKAVIFPFDASAVLLWL